MPSSWSEHRLSGRCWPIHFKPLPDELLSSWLMRLIRAQGAEPERFGLNVWGYDDFWRRDIDQGSYHEVIQVMAERTATPIDQVLATTFAGYAGFRAERISGVCGLSWILSLGLRGGRRHRPWLQYCPLCLHEDAVPYFRRHWRFAFVTVCLRHRRHLLDRCRSCGAPCNFHQLGTMTEALTQCYRCGFDARQARTRWFGDSQSHHHLAQFQASLIEALYCGQYAGLGAASVSSGWFFHMLRKLIRLLLIQRQGRERREALGQYFKLRPFDPRFPSDHSRSLEVLSIADRFRLIRLLSTWLADWPRHFIAACPAQDKLLAEVMQTMLFCPTWAAQTRRLLQMETDALSRFHSEAKT